MRWRLIAVSLLSFCLIWGLHMVLPAQHNPVRKPDLTQPLGFATYGKLTLLKRNPQLCQRVLDEAGITVSILEPDEPGGRCALPQTYVLERSLTPYSAAPLRMTCHQIAALYLLERHVMRPQAERLFGAPLSRIETYGSFSCRTIAGTRLRSQHSYANAIDIAGFELADGRTISVLNDWRTDTQEGRYLKRVHRAACRLFSVSLGPDYNAAHADHFHYDMGSDSVCE